MFRLFCLVVYFRCSDIVLVAMKAAETSGNAAAFGLQDSKSIPAPEQHCDDPVGGSEDFWRYVFLLSFEVVLTLFFWLWHLIIVLQSWRWTSLSLSQCHLFRVSDLSICDTWSLCLLFMSSRHVKVKTEKALYAVEVGVGSSAQQVLFFLGCCLQFIAPLGQALQVNL